MQKPISDPARCIPILASLNMEETRDFYKIKLGFAEDYYDDQQYLILTSSPP